MPATQPQPAPQPTATATATTTTADAPAALGPGAALLAKFKQSQTAQGDKLLSSFLNMAGGAKRQQAVEDSLVALIDQIVKVGAADALSGQPMKTIAAIRAGIVTRVEAQVNAILHHPKFLKLEGSWRSLEHLATTVGQRTDMQVQVMNIKKEELGALFDRYTGAQWTDNPIFKRVYTNEFSTWGGKPFGCLVGDYQFDHSQGDVNVMRGMMNIGAAAHCPFVAAADPELVNLRSWADVEKVAGRVAVTMSGPDYAEWDSLRDDPNASYLALTMPRFVARLPYGPKTLPAEGMPTFVEQTDGASPDKIVWANSAFAMAANIAKSFNQYGQTNAIVGITTGGLVENQKLHRYDTAEGDNAIRIPTEGLFDDVLDNEFTKSGLIPIVNKKGSDQAAFLGAASVQRPPKFEGKDGAYATSNAALVAQLPYLLSVCRIAHYIKQIGRQNLGRAINRAGLDRELNAWLSNYVLDNPNQHPQEAWIRKPFAAAKATVVDVEGSPGVYDTTFYILPHYKFAGLKVNLSLVCRVGGK